MDTIETVAEILKPAGNSNRIEALKAGCHIAISRVLKLPRYFCQTDIFKRLSGKFYFSYPSHITVFACSLPYVRQEARRMVRNCLTLCSDRGKLGHLLVKTSCLPGFAEFAISQVLNSDKGYEHRGAWKMPVRKHVLISAIGLTPQVVTETLYYFWCRASPTVPIAEVFAITTLPGKQGLDAAFLSRSPNWIDMLCRDYDLPPIRFGQEHIHVLKDADGNPLEDIWKARDNEAVADQIFALVRKIASDPGVRIHASIAGGRKTMGLYLGLAMQFYGRHGDTLSHVLVNPELESNPNFFYPPPNATAIPLADGSTFPSEQIRIELASVPLLMLREKIPFLVERSEMSYSELIRTAQIEVDGLQVVLPLRINKTSRSLHVGDVSVHLTALQFALYMIFAQRRMGCEDRCPGCENCGFYLSQIGDGELLPLLKSQLREMGFTDPRYGDLKSWGSSDPSGETPRTRFFETLSRINQRIR
jgi:CRISPR-associated protein (TIGR02584 family)